MRLSGHSFGGLVAFEMARRLRASGRPVDFLGLLDVLPPRAGLTPAERLVAAVANRLATVVPGLTDQSLREVLAARFRPGSLAPDQKLLLESEKVYNRHLPGKYDGPVTYFRARRRLGGAQNVLRAWRRISPDLSVVDVPGCHHDVLGQENVAETARRMSRAFEIGRARVPDEPGHQTLAPRRT